MQKEISVQEFQACGYLQEINRRFLHPLGLAMAVSKDGRNEMHFGPIYDMRDDPEGVIYDLEKMDAEAMQDTASKVETEFREKAAVRCNKFGYVVQPLITESEEFNGFYGAMGRDIK